MPKNNNLKKLTSFKNKLIFIKNYLLAHKLETVFIILLLLQILFRFYAFPQKANFDWDQVDSAWAAKNIIVDKHILLEGVPAKGNGGITMGPLYYYLITPFYIATNLDPIASPIFAGAMSILSFLIIYFVTKKLFDSKVALMSSLIYIFAPFLINTDRTQNAIALVIPVSYLIFYCLYKVITGSEKHILYLAVVTGFSFHVDFTSVLYPLMIILALPLFPRTRKTLWYISWGMLAFMLFLLPTLISTFLVNHSGSNLTNLFNSYYHGFHLTRVLQLSNDAFISFEEILHFKALRPFVFFVLPLFSVLYFYKNRARNSLKLFYLMGIWIVVPWFILSTYSGELTNSYFSFPVGFGIATIAFISLFIYQQKLIFIKLIPVIFWAYYVIAGIQYFSNISNGNLLRTENVVKAAIAEKKKIPFKDHHSESYIYYIYTRN